MTDDDQVIAKGLAQIAAVHPEYISFLRDVAGRISEDVRAEFKRLTYAVAYGSKRVSI